jgi:hypothetical protein
MERQRGNFDRLFKEVEEDVTANTQGKWIRSIIKQK